MRFLLKQYRKVYLFDKWMMLHFSFTGHLFIAFLIASAVFGIDTAHSTTYQLFVLLLVLLILSIVNSVFSRLKVSLTRQLPRYGTVGEPLPYSLTLFNLSRGIYNRLTICEQLEEKLPTYAELKDFYLSTNKPWFKRIITYKQWLAYLRFQRGAVVNEITLSTCLGKSPLKIQQELLPLRRGTLSFAETYLTQPDLLGLFRRLIILNARQSCLILPKRYNIRAIELMGHRKYQAGGVSLATTVGNSSEFMSLREYQYGDPLNNIHWKSFAKHRQLIVKEYRDEYFVRRSLLLDTFSGNAPVLQFEAAVSVAASLVTNEQHQEELLDLLFVSSKSYCFTTGRGVDSPEHLLEVLASVQAENTDNFLLIQQMVLARTNTSSSLVCVLMHWDSKRQLFIQQLLAHDLPIAVFLLHNGLLSAEQCPNKPPQFYLLDYHHLASELAAL